MPGATGLVAARLRAYRAVALGVVLLAALVTTALGGSASAVAQRAATDVQGSVRLATETWQVDTRLADDPAGQDATVRHHLAGGPDGAALVVERGLRSEPRDGVRLVSGPTADAALTSGRWPSAPAEAVVPEGSAATVGASYAFGDTTLEVVGTWAPGGTPWWTARDEAALVVTDDAVLASGTPFVRWSVAVRPGALTPERAVALGGHLDGLHGVLNASDVNRRGLVSAGDLPASLRAVGEQALTTRAVALVPVSIVGLVGLAALVQVVRLVVALRVDEETMLEARGLSTVQTTILGTAEGAVVGLAGAGIGSAATAAFLRASGAGAGIDAGPLLGAAALVWGAVTVAYGVVTAAGAWRLARQGSAHVRARRVVGLAAGAGLLGVGGFAAWRLWLARADTTVSDAAPSAAEAELFAVLAPAALLLVGVLLLALVLAPALHLAAAATTRRRGLALVLTVRNVARRSTAYGVPVVLLGLASGAVVLAGTYGATTTALADQGAEISAGADVRAQTGTSGPVSPRTDLTAAEAARAAGGAATLALVSDVALGEQEATLTALPARAGALLRAGSATPDLLAAIGASSEENSDGAVGGGALPGAALPNGATTLEIAARVRSGEAEHDLAWLDDESAAGAAQKVALVVWLADQGGAMVQRPAGHAMAVVAPDVARAGWHTVQAQVELPAPVGSWRVVAVDIEPASLGVPTRVEAAVDGLTSAGTEVELAPWRVVTELPSGVSDVAVDDRQVLGATVEPVYSSSATQLVRLRPGLAAGPVPVALSSTLRSRLALEVGSTTQLTIGGGRVDLVVTAVEDFLPVSVGAPGLLADLDALRSAELERRPAPQVADEVWLDGGDTAGLAALGLGEVEVRQAAGAGVAPVFWAAAGAAAVLALVGTWSVVAALDRARRSEVAALRATGLGAHEQARSRAGELLLVGALAVACGVAAGALVSIGSAGYLASLSIGLPAGVGGSPSVHLCAVAGALAVLAAGLVVLAAARGRGVAAQARDTSHREEAR